MFVLKNFDDIGRVELVDHSQGTCWAHVIAKQTQQTVDQVVKTMTDLGNGPYASRTLVFFSFYF